MTMLYRLSQAMLAQADGGSAPAAEGGAFGGMVGMLPLVLMFAVIYFLMIRPANKQRRAHQAMLNGLKKDDEVITSGGIYGRVVAIDDKVATLEIADKIKVRVQRDRIAGVPGKPATDPNARK